MKTNYYISLICCLIAVNVSAQVEKFEVYTVGTKMAFYPNACGTAIPEADGKISFCDEAGNLGVVERSYGLNSNNVIKIAPNYFNNDEVFITDKGYSIHKEDGTWLNIPEIAIPTANLSATIVSEEAIVTTDGKLIFGDTNNATGDLVYLDLTTLEFDSFTISDTVYPKEFVHDSDTGITYALVLNGTQVGLFSISGDTITYEGILSGIPQNNINWDSTAIHDGFLYVGGFNGLYKISLTDGGQNEFYDENSLPAQGLSNLEFDSAGNLWISFSYFTTGGIARFEPDTETFEFFSLENPGNGNYDILDFTLLSDDEIWTSVLNYDGFAKLEPNGTDPIWTFVPESDFESLGFPVSSNIRSINSFNDSIYFTFIGNNPDSADNFFEILKYNDGIWSGLNDDAPGNISASFANTSPGTFTDGYQISVSGDDGGVWWYSANNDLLTFLSDENITAVYDFPGNTDYLVLDANAKPTTDAGDDIVKYNAPLIQRIPTSGFDPDWITTYEDQLWAFDEQSDILHVYLDDSEIATYTIENYDNNNPISADSFGNVIYSENDSTQNEIIINTLNTSTETTNTFSYTYTGDPFPSFFGGGGSKFKQLSLPDGKMAFIAESTIFLWDNGTITELILEDLGFESFEVITSATVDAMGNLILHLLDPKLVRIIDPFGSLNIDTYRIGLASGFGEPSLLPEINFGTLPSIALESDGGIWIHGQGHFLKTTLANVIPPPANFESFRIKGQVYFDANDNDALDEGELYKNQRVALVKESETFTRYAVTDSGGEFEFLYQGEGEYTVTLLGSNPNIFSENMSTSFTVSNVEQDTDLGVFKLQTRYLDGLLVKSSEKEGAWGFERDGFENVFTTAIGNISATKDFTNLSFQFLYQNEDENSENIVPQIEDITIYRVTSETNIPVIFNTIIAPRSHNWRINDIASNYTTTILSNTPQITTTDNKVEVDFTIDQLNAKDMIVIEVETDLFSPEQNGSIIEFGLSFAGGDNLDEDSGPLSIPLIPRPIDNPKLRYPEDLPPFPNPNNPDDFPFVPEGPVYAPLPKITEIFSSYDPNDKLVSPGLPNVLNEVDLSTPYLTYTIRFENEGNFSAKDVYILDELDENLDLNSLQFIEASHDVNIDEIILDGNTNLRFFFEDIFLDYTANDPIASQGYVKFAVRPIEGIALNTIVENTAAIYFDQNPPIITNTTQNKFVDLPLSAEDFSNHKINVKAFPNPVEDSLNLILPKKDSYTVQVFDMSGRQLSSAKYTNQDQIRLSLSDLSRGQYILKISSQENSASVKILKK